MISLSSILWGKSTRMDELLISMDNQLRLYLWTISEMNRIECAKQLQNSTRNHFKKAVSHYKKRWRDRFIKPDSTLIFQDPLKMMNQLVNDSRTYHHVMQYKKDLLQIVEEPNAPQLLPVRLTYPQLC